MSDTTAPDMPGVAPWVQGAIRSFCRWHVAPEWTQELTLHASRTDTLILPSLRVTDVASVTVDGVEVTDFRFTTSGVLYLAIPVGSGVNWNPDWPVTYQVTMTHGYTDVPADILQAATRIANAPAYSSMAVDGVSFSGGSVFSQNNLAQQLIAPYQLPVLP